MLKRFQFQLQHSLLKQTPGGQLQLMNANLCLANIYVSELWFDNFTTTTLLL